MFKIGDIVEITEDSDATGMLDFKKGKGYKVEGLSYEQEYQWGRYVTTHFLITLTDESGRTDEYDASHFKLKEKEDTVVKKKECLFKEGQVVWDTSYGRGVVTYSTEVQAQVKFDSQKEGNIWFTQDGVYQLGTAARNRTLFFSEPKIEAATEPLFEPILKRGSVILANDGDEYRVIYLKIEEEDRLVDYNGSWYHKKDWEFYTLGEKINFK